MTTRDKSEKTYDPSDEKLDAIAAFIMIAAFVTGVVYWLATMPS